MSLQIRRGTEAQRAGITFDLGEIVYTTDSKKLYVGDGGTAGGINILSSAAGTGLHWDTVTNTLNFNGDLSGYTTDNIAEGTVRQYFTKSRAQDAVAEIFTAVGSPTITGTVTSTAAPHTITVNSNAGLVALEPFIVTGTGGNGLTTGTYYIVNPAAGSNQITVANSLFNAQSGVPITVTTGGLTTTQFSAGGGDANITFTYDSTAKTMTANVSSLAAGIPNINADHSPLLGGTLGLNSYSIQGTGNINIQGNITNSGTISSTTGLGANLGLNSHSITGNGDININGSITASSVNGLNLNSNNNSINIGSATINTIVNAYSNNISFTTSDVNGSDNQVTTYIHASRGTLTAPSALALSDQIGSTIWRAYTGSGFTTKAFLTASIDPTTNGSNSLPANILIGISGNNTDPISNGFWPYTFQSNGAFNSNALLVGDGTANVPSIGFITDGSQDTGFFHPGDGIIGVTVNGTEKARFDSGGFRTTGFSKVGSFAGSGTFPSPAEAGMIIFDSNTTHFYGYNGTTWKQLDN